MRDGKQPRNMKYSLNIKSLFIIIQHYCCDGDPISKKTSRHHLRQQEATSLSLRSLAVARKVKKHVIGDHIIILVHTHYMSTEFVLSVSTD